MILKALKLRMTKITHRKVSISKIKWKVQYQDTRLKLS